MGRDRQRRQCSGPGTNPQTGTRTGGGYNSMSDWFIYY